MSETSVDRSAAATTPGTGSSVSRYARGSVANMIRSLAVIGGLMVLLVLLVPRVSSVSQPPVDVVGPARQVAASTGLPIQVPQDLPEGWRATSVRYVRSTDGVMTWHAGYVTPDNQSVAVEQAVRPTNGWIRAQVNRAAVVGELEAAGRTWTKYVREKKVQNSLVNRPASDSELTTIVTGTGTFDQLRLFAEHLRTVEPG